jgi:hypothetical protein
MVQNPFSPFHAFADEIASRKSEKRSFLAKSRRQQNANPTTFILARVACSVSATGQMDFLCGKV